jgi:hypothetical protein
VNLREAIQRLEMLDELGEVTSPLFAWQGTGRDSRLPFNVWACPRATCMLAWPGIPGPDRCPNCHRVGLPFLDCEADE